MQITLTPDYQQLAILHQQCFEHGWSVQDFTELYTIKGTLAVIDDKAFAVIRILAGEAEIITLGVLPDYRKHNIASAMVREIVNYCQHNQVNSLFLEVRQSNQSAIKLYHNAGFKVIAIRKEYYRNPDNSYENALMMQKTIF